jgi:hypothetical protein
MVQLLIEIFLLFYHFIDRILISLHFVYIGGFSFRELIVVHRAVADISIVDVLRGMALPDDLHWPPASFEQAVHYEKLMTETAEGPLKTILESGAIADGHKLLDCGGGEGQSLYSPLII